MKVVGTKQLNAFFHSVSHHTMRYGPDRILPISDILYTSRSGATEIDPRFLQKLSNFSCNFTFTVDNAVKMVWEARGIFLMNYSDPGCSH
jgi:hypothetical protein